MTRLLPIWPGPRMPFITRAGQAEAPIEPGARTLCEPWDLGPLAKLWRLIVPWKPLPLEVPEILTFWPGSKASTVTVVADLQLAGLVAELDEVAAWAAASAFLRWPSSGLERCFSLVAPNASWTAS